jgi:hypothetical protein
MFSGSLVLFSASGQYGKTSKAPGFRQASSLFENGQNRRIRTEPGKPPGRIFEEMSRHPA